MTTSTPEHQQPESWPDKPIPLSTETARSLILAEAIPPTLPHLRSYIEAVSEELQVSTDATAALAMATSSFATARAFEIELRPGWIETSVLWSVVVLESGERKSALLSRLTKPIQIFEQFDRARLAPALAGHAELRRLLEARLEALHRQITRARPGEDTSGSQREAVLIAGQLEATPELRVPNLCIDDFTPESLRDNLAMNGEKLLFASTETDAAQLMGARYAESANINLLLKAHTGEPYTATRANGKLVELQRPALALALCVQPAAVESVLRDSSARERGLVPRMLLVRPPSKLGHREIEPEPTPQELVDYWTNTVCALLNQPWPGRIMVSPSGPIRSAAPPRVLRLSIEADDAFLDMVRKNERRLGGDLRPIAAFASKLPGAIGRIALNLQLLECPTATEVSGDVMRAAIEWVPFLIKNFKATCGDAAEPDDIRHARKLIGKLRGRTHVTQREAFQMMDSHSGIRKMADLIPVLETLETRGWIRRRRVAAEGGRGRPTDVILCHPCLHSSRSSFDGD